MSASDFTATGAISYGWGKLKENPAVVLPPALFYILLAFLYLGVERVAPGPVKSLLTLFILLILVYAGFLLTIYLLVIARNEQPEYSLFWSWQPLFPRYFLALLLYLIMVAVGFALLILPGIYLSIRFAFFPYFIIEEGKSPWEALASSAAITGGSIWKLFLLNLLIVGIFILGLLFLGVGLFAAVPTGYLAHIHAYRLLREKN